MKINIKNIDPSGSIENVIYKIFLLYRQPLHYKKIKELLIEVGYYELNGRKAPKDYTAIFRSLRLDGRLVRLGRGYYGLKEANLESYISTELKIDCEDFEDITANDQEIKNAELLNFNMTYNSNVPLEDENMNTKINFEESIFPQEVITFLQHYYSDEELEDSMQRAKKEYYDKFLPQFIAGEMNRIIEKCKV